MLEIKNTKVSKYEDEQKARGTGQLMSRRDLETKNPYERFYNKFKMMNNKYLNDDFWVDAQLRGELDQMILALEKNPTNRYLDELKEFESRLDYDTYMLALTAPLLDNKIEKDRLNEDGSENYGKMTDQQWAETILHSTKNRYIAETIEEGKENRTFWQKAGQGLLTGFMSFVGTVAKGLTNVASYGYNLFEALVYAARDDKTMAEAFGNDDYLSNVAQQVDYAVYQFNMLTGGGWFNKVSALDAYYAGVDFSAMTDLNISLGDKAFTEAIRKTNYENGGHTTYGRLWDSAWTSIGEMLPFMMIPSIKIPGHAKASKALTQVVKSGSFYTVNVFSSSISGSVEAARRAGISYEDMNMGQIITNAALKTVAQYLMEIVTGKMLGFTKLDTMLGVGEDISNAGITQFIKAVKAEGGKAVGRAVGRGLLSMAKEGLEETLQELSDVAIDTFFNKHVDDKMFSSNFSLQNLIDSFVVGALTSGVIGTLSSASVVISKNRSVRVGEDGKAYRLGFFEQLNYNQALRAMASWQEVLEDSKADVQSKADAAFKLNSVLATVGNTLRTFGSERASKALELLNTYQDKMSDETKKREAKLKLSDVDYAKELIKEFNAGNIVAELTLEQQKSLEKAAKQSAKDLKKDGVTEIKNVITQETKESDEIAVESAKVVKHLLKQTNSEMIVATDGKTVVTSDDVIFAPEGLIKTGNVSKILEGIAYDKAVNTIIPNLTAEQIDFIVEQYKLAVGRENVTTEEAIIAMLFDKSFYTYLLLKANETQDSKVANTMINILSILDSIIQGKLAVDVKKNTLTQAAYDKLIKKIQENMRAGLVVYAINYTNIDLDNISGEILPGEYKELIRNNRNVIATTTVKNCLEQRERGVITEERIAAFDREIDAFKGRNAVIDRYVEIAKQQIRSENYNDRYDACGVLRYLLTLDEEINVTFLRSEEATKAMGFDNNTLTLVSEFFDVSWENLLNGNFKLEDLTPEAQQYVLGAGYDIDSYNDRIAMLRERLFHLSNNTLTLSYEGEVLQVLDKQDLVKNEYLDNEQQLIDDIKSGKVKTVQDAFKVKVDNSIGDLKIELNSDLQANGGFNENNPTKIMLSGRSILKSLMHETTHATQYFTRPDSAEKISTGANIDHLKNAKQEVLNDIDAYVKKNFPTTYDIMTRSANNDIPTIIYFNIDGEMQATCKLTSLLFESGFTWSRDKSTLYSPDGKQHWDLTLKTEVKSSVKNTQKSNKEVKNNEQSSNVSNIVDRTVGENSTESSERVETNTNEQSKTRPSSKDIRARFEKIDGHQVKKVGKIYANIETKVDTNDSIVTEGKNVYGVNVFYYSGTVYDEDGEQHAARGFTDGKNIYITKGLSKNAAKKVLKHEYFHIKKRQNRELFNELKDKLIEVANKEQLDNIIKRYSQVYAGLSGDKILEEIIADLYAGFLTVEMTDATSVRKLISKIVNNKQVSVESQPYTGDIAFSIRPDGQERLMAITATSFDLVLEALKTHQLTAPCIGINTEYYNANQFFGNIHVVWKKSAVNPKGLSKNSVFMRDAYTGRLNIGSKVVGNYDVAKVEKLLNGLMSEITNTLVPAKTIDKLKSFQGSLNTWNNIGNVATNLKVFTNKTASIAKQAAEIVLEQEDKATVEQFRDALSMYVKHKIANDVIADYSKMLKNALVQETGLLEDIIRFLIKGEASVAEIKNTLRSRITNNTLEEMDNAELMLIDYSKVDIQRYINQTFNKFEIFGKVKTLAEYSIENLDSVYRDVVHNIAMDESNRSKNQQTVEELISHVINDYVSSYSLKYYSLDNPKVLMSEQETTKYIKNHLINKGKAGVEVLQLGDGAKLPEYFETGDTLSSIAMDNLLVDLAKYLSHSTTPTFDTFKQMKDNSKYIDGDDGLYYDTQDKYTNKLITTLRVLNILFPGVPSTVITAGFEDILTTKIYSREDSKKFYSKVSKFISTLSKYSLIPVLKNKDGYAEAVVESMYKNEVLNRIIHGFDVKDMIKHKKFDKLMQLLSESLAIQFDSLLRLNNERLEHVRYFEAKPLTSLSTKKIAAIFIPNDLKDIISKTKFNEYLKDPANKHIKIQYYEYTRDYEDINKQLDELPDELDGEAVKFSKAVDVEPADISESRYVSNKVARQSNLKYYEKKGTPIQLNEKLQDFIVGTTANFDKLDKPLQESIKKGELDIQTIRHYVETTDKMSDYTFKAIAKYIFQNEEVAKLTFDKMIEILEYAQFVEILKLYLNSNSKDIDKVQSFEEIKKQYKDMIELGKKDVKVDRRIDKLMTISNSIYFKSKNDRLVRVEVLGSGDTSDDMIGLPINQLHGAFFRHYDSTIRSISNLSNLGKHIIHNQQALPQNQYSKDKSTTWNWVTRKRTADIDYGSTDSSVKEVLRDVTRSEKIDVIQEHIIQAIIAESKSRNWSKEEVLEKFQTEREALYDLTDSEINKMYMAAISEGVTKFSEEDNKLKVELQKRYSRAWKRKGDSEKGIEAVANTKYEGKYASRKVAKGVVSQTGENVASKIGRQKIRYDSLPDNLKPLFSRKSNNNYEFNKEYLKLSDQELDKVAAQLQQVNRQLNERIRFVAASNKLKSDAIERANNKSKTLTKNEIKPLETKQTTVNHVQHTYTTIIHTQEYDIQIPNKEKAPIIVEKVLSTNWDKSRMSTVQGVSNNSEQNITDAKTFFENNPDLVNISTNEAEQSAKWFLAAKTNDTMSEQDKQKFEAIKLYFLGYIFGETDENGQFSDLDGNVRVRIENYLKETATAAGRALAVWNNVLKRLNPIEVMLSQSIVIDGVELDKAEQEELFNAAKNNEMDKVGAITTKILNRIKKQSKKKKKIARQVTTYRSMAMLANPLTWLRNKISNMALKFLNKISSFVGGKVFKKHTVSGQIKFKGNITPEIKEFIETHFINNKLFDTVVSNLSKYNPSEVSKRFKNQDGSMDKNAILTNMVIKAMYGKYYSENTFESEFMNKVYKWLMDRMSDNNYVREAAIRYFGKIIAEKNYDLSKGVTDKIMTDFANAIGIAMADYMHSDNFFNTLEAIAAEHGEMALFAYKNTVPFLATTWNWFKAAMRFSPLGLLKSIYDITHLDQEITKQKGRWEQGKSQLSHEYTEYIVRRNLGSGIIGTCAFALGILLSLLGFIDLDEDDYGVPKLTIPGVDAIEVDVSDIFGTSSLLAGAALISEFKNSGVSWSSLIKGFDNALDVTLDGFFLTEIMALDLYSGGGSFATITDWFESFLLSFIPNGVGWIAGATYTGTIRKGTGLKGFFRKAAAKIPFLGNFFAKKVDPYTGETGGFLDLFNRVFPYLDIDVNSKLEKKAKSLGLSKSELSGHYKINNEEFNLSNKDITLINEMYGKWNADSLTAFLNDEVRYSVKDEDTGRFKMLFYSDMTDKQRKNTFDNIMSNNAENAKIAAWLKAGNYYYASAEKYTELRRLGIDGNLYRGSNGFVKK